MAEAPPFTSFAKIPRLNREVTITEKIDGTNASVLITEDGDLFVGSRSRWITPAKSDDNFGFAAFVEGNRATFEKLGPGHHFGEWWGQGIQRGYGLTERRFSLLNTKRWTAETTPDGLWAVPVVVIGSLAAGSPGWALQLLAEQGSFAAPGFMKPEGIVVYHSAANHCFKVTLERDEEYKGKGAE